MNSNKLVSRLRKMHEDGKTTGVASGDIGDFVSYIALKAANEIERLEDKIRLLEDDIESIREHEV